MEKYEHLIGTLFQYIEKHHMEAYVNEEITDEEWEHFLRVHQSPFAEVVSQLANQWWLEWEKDN